MAVFLRYALSGRLVSPAWRFPAAWARRDSFGRIFYFVMNDALILTPPHRSTAARHFWCFVVLVFSGIFKKGKCYFFVCCFVYHEKIWSVTKYGDDNSRYLSAVTNVNANLDGATGGTAIVKCPSSFPWEFAGPDKITSYNGSWWSAEDRKATK